MGDLVLYGGASSALALANRQDPEAQAAEKEKRIKEAQELEEKLKMINEQVPTRVYNVCSSSAGAGSGDFHMYRMIRRAEQERQKRLDEEFKKKQEMEGYEAKKQQREKEAEDRTAKRRAKRQKKKSKKKAKTSGAGGSEDPGSNNAEDDESEDDAPKQAALD